jgi:hypothetical protein
MGQKRRRVKHVATFEERLEAFADKARQVAAHLPPGAAKDEMLRTAQQVDLNKHFESLPLPS